MRTTFPRSPAAVNGCELTQLVTLLRESNSPSLGEWKAAGARRCTSALADPNVPSWVAAMAVAAVPRKRRRSWLIASDISLSNWRLDDAHVCARRRSSSYYRVAPYVERNGRNAARSSVVNVSGCSHAAKCPPLGSRL